MKNNIFIVGVLGLLLTSCVSQKKYSDLESLQQNTKELLDSATAKLYACGMTKNSGGFPMSIFDISSPTKYS